jgi:hypothetical protein
MARRFRRTRHGIGANLDDVERDLLARLLDDVDELLDDGTPAAQDPLAAMVGIAEHARTPEDPAVARLLPDASPDDPEQAMEFRRFTELGLRARKRRALRTARATLDRRGALVLTDDEAQAWLTALTDVRLVLAERLGLRTDEDAEQLHAELDDADEDDPRAWLAAVYDFLTWLQETLVAVLMEDLPDSRGEWEDDEADPGV